MFIEILAKKNNEYSWKWISDLEIKKSQSSSSLTSAASSSLPSLMSLSWMGVSLTPCPLGREIAEVFPSPITKALLSLVAKTYPAESLMWAMSYDPGCFSTDYKTPILPMLFPPIKTIVAPFVNLTTLLISPVARFN